MLESELLSPAERRVRSVYLSMRAELEQTLFRSVFGGSYQAFKDAGSAYPFHERKELKPGSKVPSQEYELFNEAFVIFSEGTIPPEYRNHLRTRRSTKFTKDNLVGRVLDVELADFDSDDRNVTSPNFPNLLSRSLDLDSALVIQRDPTVTARGRYALTDGFVKVDFPVTDAAERLARHLRYVSKKITDTDIPEEVILGRTPVADRLEEKFFEYYGFHHATAGNRRTASAVAAQLLRVGDHMSTVYMASQEERAMTRICGSDLSKYALIRVPKKDVRAIEDKYGVDMDDYTIDETKKGRVVLFQLAYSLTPSSTPPLEKKVREFDPSLRKKWRRIKHELILPKPGKTHLRPLPFPAVTKPRNGLL